MSSAWVDILERDVAFFRELDRAQQQLLLGRIREFVGTQNIVGEHGLRVDDRVRVLVAAPACRLALYLPAERFRRLEAVNVMPTAFQSDKGLCHGAALGCYTVSLAFDALEHGLAESSDGKNVGYHEFAHVLDASDGTFDGVPPLLLDPPLRLRWVQVLARELSRLRAAVAASIPTVIHSAAIEGEAELFAYATEVFFERPRALLNAHPELYELLSAFYGQNPLRTSPGRSSAVR